MREQPTCLVSLLVLLMLSGCGASSDSDDSNPVAEQTASPPPAPPSPSPAVPPPAVPPPANTPSPPVVPSMAGSSPDMSAGGPSPPDTPSKPRSKTLGTPVECIEAYLACLDEMGDMVDAIDSPEAANAAIPKVREFGLRLKTCISDCTRSARTATPAERALVTSEHRQRTKKGLSRVLDGVKRLKQVPGMPTDFFLTTNVTILELARFVDNDPNLVTIDIVAAIRRKFGNQVVTVVLRDCPEEYTAFKRMEGRLRQLAGPGAASQGLGTRKERRVTVGPVSDIDAYAAELNLGKTWINKSRREIVIQVDLAKTGPDSGKAPADEAPASEDPADLKKKLKLAMDTNVSKRRKALEELNGIDPDRVAAEELRTEIARLMKDVAFDEKTDGTTRAMAAQGLVTWGGRHGVPLLLKLLKSPDLAVRRGCYKALAKSQDKRAIDPVAAHYATATLDRHDALQCLKTFGPMAEPALLKLLRNKDVGTVAAVVTALGEIGTKKSIRSLQMLRTRQSYQTLRGSVDAAMKAIDNRAGGGRR